MSAITAKASRKMKKYAVLTREPRCFLGSFDFSWEQRKLGELGTITTGNTPSTSIPDYYSDDGIVWVTPTDICENITFESARKLSDLGQQVGRVVPKNTILVTCIASIGKNTMLGNTGSFNQQINGLTPNENKYDPYFLLTESALWSAKMKGSAASGTMQIVNRTEFSELKTWLPSLIEQQAIGAFFKQLDNLITLHQRKCANLCSPSQVVFSLLFATSTFSWEQRKLSEITDKVTEKNAGLQYVETFTNSAEFGIISQRDFFDHDIAKLGSLDGYYIVKNEDFVYNPRISTSAPVGPINRNKLGRTGVMSPLYTVFRPHDIDTTYLEYFFKCGYWHSFMNFNGDSGARSDRFSIRDNVFFQMPIPIPDIDEQRKIGELLTCLDNLITLHQRECISFTGRADRLILTANKKRTTSSWEQRKLGDIASDMVAGGDIDKDLILAEGQYPVIANALTGDGIVGYYDKEYRVNAPAVTVTGRGDVGHAKARLVNFTPVVRLLSVKSEHDVFFLENAINTLKIVIESTGVPQLTVPQLAKYEVAFPRQLDEEEHIGAFFKQLDHLITLHQRKPFLMKWRTSDANRNQTNRLVL